MVPRPRFAMVNVADLGSVATGYIDYKCNHFGYEEFAWFITKIHLMSSKVTIETSAAAVSSVSDTVKGRF